VQIGSRIPKYLYGDITATEKLRAKNDFSEKLLFIVMCKEFGHHSAKNAM
jgi:hypothetical protein